MSQIKPKLSILMVAPQPFFSARGTPFSVLHRIRALIALGHNVDLVTYGYGDDIKMDGLRILRSKPLPFIKRVKIGPSIPKIVLDVILYFDTKKALNSKQYDVFHSHEEAAFFFLSLAGKHKLPHLYDMHSSLPQQLSNFKAYNVGIFRKIFERLEDKVLSSCDAIITICDDLAKIVEQGYSHKPHRMIENIGEDRKVFQANDTDWQTKLGINNGPVLLYTGTFEAYQGIDLFLKSIPIVLKSFPTATALMVGGNPKQVIDYKAQAHRLGLDNNIRFTGTVHPSNIPNLIDLSTAIVSPRSRGTNTPLKIYNYMRAGKPLIATDRLTHTQILKPNTACLVDASPEGFASGIHKVLSDTQYAQQISQAAQDYANKHFSDDAFIDMVGGIYNEMFTAIEGKHL